MRAAPIDSSANEGNHVWGVQERCLHLTATEWSRKDRRYGFLTAQSREKCWGDADKFLVGDLQQAMQSFEQEDNLSEAVLEGISISVLCEM